MDYQKFYKELFAPLAATLGPIDTNSIVAIIGFDLGGPLNFSTFGRDSNRNPITYVSCELAVRQEQQPNAFGRYELLASCDSEDWVRSILTDTGRMTLDNVFNADETMDIGGWVNEGWFKRKPPIQGLLFQKECSVMINGQPYGVLRCIGITRREMEYAQSTGSPALVSRLKEAGVYPHTITSRKSVI